MLSLIRWREKLSPSVLPLSLSPTLHQKKKKTAASSLKKTTTGTPKNITGDFHSRSNMRINNLLNFWFTKTVFEMPSGLNLCRVSISSNYTCKGMWEICLTPQYTSRILFFAFRLWKHCIITVYTLYILYVSRVCRGCRGGGSIRAVCL